ncbi:MAG: patatin-like phospholipase family protein, partial [Proteobacteria bacterium]|nr:patatin-like phospholipase family protein [Pseudomonadota bacterium]
MKKVEWDQVYEGEQQYITKYLKGYDAKKSIGLALSGGGIRSTAFSIGVIQALHNKNILGKISYLSTVSGGGFSGSALTWFKLKFETFPFGDKKTFQGSQAFVEGEDGGLFKTLKKTSTSASNAILSYIRQHGNYLVPFELGKAALLARALLSVLHSALAYLLIISLVFFLLFLLIYTPGVMECVWKTLGYIGVDKATISNLLHIWKNNGPSTLQVNFTAFFILATVGFGGFYAILIVLYGLSTFVSQETTAGYCSRVWVERAMGWLVTLLAGALVLALIPLGLELMAFTGDKAISTGVFGGTTIIGALVAVFKFWQNISGKESKGGVLSSLLMQAVVLLVIFAVLSLGFRVGAFAFKTGTSLWLLFAVTAFMALVVNLNLVSPHRMYRDRLAETFLWNFDKGAEAKLCDRGKLALHTPLSEMVTDK